jgi:ABC-type uncharacterized transport system substrate-binding protein
VNRRAFITLLGGAAAAWPLAARAQQPGKVWRIGVLSIGSAATARHLVDAFFKGMADLGYHEGSNVHYEVRYGEASMEKFEQYAREYISAKTDLIPPPLRHKKRLRLFQSSSRSWATQCFHNWCAILECPELM